MSGRSLRRALGLGGCLFAASGAFSQSVPGFTVQTYALVTDPIRICFAPDGSMFAGRDATGSGGTNSQAVKIHRIAPLGLSTAEYGSSTIPDPDAVIFDATGTVSGTPGSVIVGSAITTTTGRLTRIPPSQIVGVLYNGTAVQNPGDFVFDSSSRLLVVEPGIRVVRFTGATPANLFTATNIATVDVDSSTQNIYTGGTDGPVRSYTSAGAVISNPFCAFPAAASGTLVALSNGAPGLTAFGYALNGGSLYTMTSTGVRATIGTGFATNASDLVVGPDGALYVSDFASDRVLRIAPNATRTLSGRVVFNDFAFGTPPTSVDILVRNPVTEAVVNTTSVTLGANGEFSVTVPASGVFNVSTKTRAWLRRSAIADARTADASALTINLINGDIDGDDSISILDYISLSAAFGTELGSPGWDPLNDLDGDDLVSILDYIILSSNYGLDAN